MLGEGEKGTGDGKKRGTKLLTSYDEGSRYSSGSQLLRFGTKILIEEKMAQKQKKVVFVMIDGLADVQIPAYNFQTPLEHAQTPWMDAMASKFKI
jgi:hypothetical protein